jgi:hypothetical protein
LGQKRTTRLAIGADIRIVETKTGQVLAARSQKVKRLRTETAYTEADAGLLVDFQHEVCDELVQRLVADAIDTLFPIKVAMVSKNTVYLNRADLVPGTKYEVVKLGDIRIHDPDTGEDLGQTEVRLATITVTQGLDKSSKAEVSKWFVEDKDIPKGSLCRLVLPEADGTQTPKP